MEFLIILMSIVAGFLTVLGIIFLVHDTWKEVKRALRDSDLMMFAMFGAFMLSFVYLVTFFAINNTFWHIDYWTTEGLWKK